MPARIFGGMADMHHTIGARRTTGKRLLRTGG